MSQENVESYKRTIDAWNRDDYETWIDHFDSEFEWVALLEVFHGHEGARQAWEDFKADLQLKVRLDDVRDLGDSVLALGELDATGGTTQLSVDRKWAQVVTYRRGKIIRYRDFPTQADALKAAGLADSQK